MIKYKNLLVLLLCISFACGTASEQEKTTIQASDSSRKVVDFKAKQTAQNQQNDTLTTHIETKDTARQKIPMLALRNSKTNLADVLKKIKKGDSTLVVCYGNSITNGYKVGTTTRVDRPYPEVLQEMLRAHFDNSFVEVSNQGHNGWRSREALQNLEALVISQKPDLVILKFGINDAYSSVSKASFEQNMRQVVDLLKQYNIAVLLLRTSPINTPYEPAVSSYATVLLSLAEEKKIAFFDLHTALLKRLDKENISLKSFLPDDVHLADEYYAWIAEAIFEFLTEE